MNLDLSKTPISRLFEIAITAIGVVLVIGAVAANQRWFDRHFMPSFFLPRVWYVRIQMFVRLALATLGVSLALIARFRAPRLAAGLSARAFPVVVAAALALGASEFVLRRVHLRPVGWLLPAEEPWRRPDPRLGWSFVPARTGRSTVGGRTIDYAIDASGYRVRRTDDAVDPERAAILFTGESVMFGEGLTWEESVPAQVGARLNLQSVNLAVHGYGTDQSFLRLQAELPRFRRPVAVVTLFMTALFGRNLDDDRPHLGPGLLWLPPKQHSRLASLGKLLVPYRSVDTVERGIRVTREVLGAGVNLSRARGATPLIVVPQFGPEEPVERMLRRRIIEEAGLPHVWIELDAAWRLPWDRHPNAHAARTIAAAVAARLRAP